MVHLVIIVALMFTTVMVVGIGERTRLPWPVLLSILTALVVFIPGIPH